MIANRKNLKLLRATSAVMATTLALGAASCDSDGSAEGGNGGEGGESVDNPGGDGGQSGGGEGGEGGESDNGASGEGTGSTDGSGDPDAVYMVAVRVWAQDSTLTYVKLSHELDLSFSTEDFDGAREFGGYSGFTIEDGHVLNGDQETPFVTKFAINEDLTWQSVGEPLNFTDYFTEDGDGLNDYYQAKKGNDQFFFYGPERTSRLHYRVREWEYAGNYEDTNLPIREGWVLQNAGNRTGIQGFRDAIVWPFVLAPDEALGTEGTPESYLAVYDGETYAETDIIEPSCPELTQATMDEDGNLYFSPTWRSPLFGLYAESVPNCIVKVKPDGTVDESFGPDGEQSIEDLTGGIPGINFRYIGGGKAVANLLNVDEIEGADFDGARQEEVTCQVEWCEDAPELENPELWESYVIDLETKTARRMTGYDPDFPGYGGYRIYWQIDDRTFFMGYGDAGLAMYELDPETAVVSLAGDSEFPADAEHEYAVIARIR